MGPGPMDPAAVGHGVPCACPGCDREALADRSFCPACEDGLHTGHCPRCRRVLYDLRPPACPGCGADLAVLRRAWPLESRSRSGLMPDR